MRRRLIRWRLLKNISLLNAENTAKPEDKVVIYQVGRERHLEGIVVGTLSGWLLLGSAGPGCFPVGVHSLFVATSSEFSRTGERFQIGRSIPGRPSSELLATPIAVAKRETKVI